ncbi:MAG: asparagine synthase C-terminal domain-containing protein, partial [Alphaproteobacteria bacterium]
AFTLSGGLDSSSVVCAAARLTGVRQAAFSTVYGGGEYDESAEIADVIDHGAATWTPVPVGAPDLFALVDTLTAQHDQPLSTVTWLTHHLLCSSLRDAGFESVFGGLGGDEQHAGEYDYFPYFFADLLAAGADDRYHREVAAWQRQHDHPVWRKSETVATARRLALTDPATPGRCRIDRALFDRYADAVDPANSRIDSIPLDLAHPYASYLRSHSYNELYRETMPCCLRASDRNTEAFGLVDLSPYFDHRLVDFMFRVSPLIKTRDGVTKQILRRAMTGLLPEATRTRIGKTGWNAPIHHWFATSLREPLLDLVRSRRFRERGIYRPAEVERLIAEHGEIVSSGAARENHMMFLWQVISLEGWLDWLDGLSATMAAGVR